MSILNTLFANVPDKLVKLIRIMFDKVFHMKKLRRQQHLSNAPREFVPLKATSAILDYSFITSILNCNP